MKTNEEKVKEFFSNEKKVKEFMKDEDFINKVSCGTATPQDYIEEFNKFDINLTPSEAEKVYNKTNKLLSMPPEKLADEAISKVVGGVSPAVAGVFVDLGITALGGLACIPIGIAASSCAIELQKAKKEGNIKETDRLVKKYQILMYSMTGVIGATGCILGPAAGFATYAAAK